MAEPDTPSATRRVPRSGLAVGALVLAGAAVAGTWWAVDGRDGSDPGPLVLPDGHRIVLAATDEAAWVSVGGCTPQPVDLQVTRVEVIDSWSTAQLSWLVAWPSDLFEIGADRGTAPRPPFTPLARDEGGRTVACGSGQEGPLLAVQFPAGVNDRGFDRIRVHYTADGTEHVSEHDIGFGVCGPADGTHCASS